MTPSQKLKMRGFLVIFLLAGGECARVSNVAHMDAKLRETSALGQKSGWFWSVGNEVCREGSDVARYQHKIAKLREIGAIVADSSFNYPRVLQLMGRMTQFETCSSPSVVRSLPEDLRNEIFSNEANPNSLKSVIVETQVQLNTFMKNQNKLEDDGHCGFHPEAVVISEAAKASTPQHALLHQIFGAECTMKMIDKYIGKQSARIQKSIGGMTSTMMNILANVKGVAKGSSEITEESVEEVRAQALKHLDAVKTDVKEVDDAIEEEKRKEGSLVEVGTELTGNNALGMTGAEIVMVILVAAFLICLVFLTIQWVYFLFFSNPNDDRLFYWDH